MQIDTTEQGLPICPHCGACQRKHEVWLITGQETYECEWCAEYFWVEVVPLFTTSKVEEVQ